MTNGIIYIAFSPTYVAEVLHSAKTLKAVCDLPVTLFTDIEVDSPYVDTVVRIKPGHKRAKVDFISESPYERTLYLDSDTEIQRDISDVFQILDKFDVAAVHDHCRKNHRWSGIPEYESIPYAFPEYNGGVMLYRNNQNVHDFFDLWRSHFYKNIALTNGQDQASLRIALWEADLRLHTLPFEFNVRSQFMRNRMAKRAREPGQEGLLAPRILHWHRLNTHRGLARLLSKYRPMKY